MSEEQDVTLAIRRAADGDEQAIEEVARWAYRRLERLAAKEMGRAFGPGLPGVTLEPSALVNETFLKLLEGPLKFENRRHFFAFASTVLKRVLLDYHRRRGAAKRGGDAVRLTLSAVADGPGRPPTADGADLAAALEELESLDPRKAEVVTLRVLWGFEMAEIAELLELSLSTVERDWRFTRSWLAERLQSA